ncbi:hypothetical protein TUSST3_05210 [Streptomyces sp. TUS-ST3]|nr:hypothetical protein TUSST3_05210 [Streptomyces sp. TUS-ST3]
MSAALQVRFSYLPMGSVRRLASFSQAVRMSITLCRGPLACKGARVDGDSYWSSFRGSCAQYVSQFRDIQRFRHRGGPFGIEAFQ